jgi:peptidoglycan/LPS O-acetylase OafA/YrhL
MGLVRFYLALAVAAFHAGIILHKEAGLPWGKELILGMDGWHAVIFFYIVSGFLISYVLEHKYPLTPSSTAAFYRARFLRIYPLWWAVCAFSFFTWGDWSFMESGVPTMVSVITLIGLDWLVGFRNYPELDFSFFLPYTALGWTLSVEITFYALAPFCCDPCRRPFSFSPLPSPGGSSFGPPQRTSRRICDGTSTHSRRLSPSSCLGTSRGEHIN